MECDYKFIFWLEVGFTEAKNIFFYYIQWLLLTQQITEVKSSSTLF